MNKPKSKDFHTDHGMHSAMQQWANDQRKSVYSVEVLYSDSDDLFTSDIIRATKEVKYKTRDGEVYTVHVDTGKFVNTFMPGDYELTLRDFKIQFEEWTQPTNPNHHIVSIKWIEVK